MLYSREQLKNIERQKANIKRNIEITNLRSKGIQDILVDGQIPHELINESIRNTNDLENDKFALQAELNKLTSNILKTGDIYSLQQRLETEGLTKFFIENYPRIVHDSKMYRSPTTNNVLMITKKLFNKHLKELNYNSSDVDSLMNTLDHISSMIVAQNDPNMRDNIQKIDAIRHTAGKVDDAEVFMKSLLGVDDYLQYLQDDPTDALSRVSPTAIENAYKQSTSAKGSQNSQSSIDLPDDPYELLKMQLTQFSKRADLDGLAKEISKKLKVNAKSLLTDVSSKEDLLKVAFDTIDKQRDSHQSQKLQEKQAQEEAYDIIEDCSNRLQDPNIAFGDVQKIASTLRNYGYQYKQQKSQEWVTTLINFCNDAMTEIENLHGSINRKPSIAVAHPAPAAAPPKIPTEKQLYDDIGLIRTSDDMNVMKRIAGYYNKEFGISIYDSRDKKDQLRKKLDDTLNSLMNQYYPGRPDKLKKKKKPAKP
jgi:hypothetical protein